MKRVLLSIGGGLNLLFAVFHLMMPAAGWDQAMAGVDPAFRSIVYILNASIAVTLVVFAYLSIFQAKGMATTGVGRAAAIGIAAWWLARIGEGIYFDGIVAGAFVLYAICLAVAVLYLAAALLPSRAPQAQSITL